MAETTADILIDTIHRWGVDVVFGMPGDGINGIMEALRKRKDDIRFVQVRHEESAAFMACGYAKWTGKLGCCLATSGPGGIHLLNGLYDAKLDGAPVLALAGMIFHDLIQTLTQQDVELDKLFMDVAVYNARVMGPSHVENVAELACRTALARCGVAHVTIPVDIQDMVYRKAKTSKRNKPGHSAGTALFRASGPPAPESLKEAADLLNAGEKVMILAGRDAIGATAEVEQVAELLGAPVAKPLLGKMAMPDDSSYCIGSVGLLGRASDAAQNCVRTGKALR